MSDRVFLITGATGQQGGAVVKALLDQPSRPYTILAVTRNPESASAKALAASSPAIKLLKGDLADPAPLFRTAREVTSQPVWGVFSIQTPGGKGQTAETEEAQGKALVDESIKNGVKHFVQTSVERGGDAKSWENPTNIPHFISKHNIELYLREQAEKAGGSMTWTILRPVAFFDNFKPGFGTRVFLTALQNELGSKPLQFVAVKDIGKFGASALLNGQSSAYKNQAIGLAGDELNAKQAIEVFQQKVASPPALTFGILGSALTWGVKEMGIHAELVCERGLRCGHQEMPRTERWYDGSRHMDRAGGPVAIEEVKNDTRVRSYKGCKSEGWSFTVGPYTARIPH